MTTRPALTPSELRVLNALPLHATTASIAAAFHVSPNTIKSQLKALYRKLECSSREGAIKTASQLRIIADDDVYGGDRAETFDRARVRVNG
ncbi:DNA-binding CsgD family transcriptional regulator [Leucobacter exalbidus]|uniref:DNA-binding CsgD family transcriptional regulator n=1 Tax=Leucobacter exalbidus TaxID=662960 RepID=A0A940PVC5_9MICO|nr:LuxR C-terminal-related transcriptional regulator [Leucobacter exalbidus]MBP1325896.1 DNA-binding CsgD family transcriptional regulator [Leucobacter exalbidus]